MQIRTLLVLSATVFLAAAPASISSAQDFTLGQEPVLEGDARAAPGLAPRSNARAVEGIAIDPTVGTRDAGLDVEAARRAYTLIGRNSNGEEVRVEPGEKILRGLEGKPRSGDQRGALEPGVDPDLAGEESERAVIGSDDRVRVASTRTYPFSTVGYLEAEDAQGNIWTCTAAVIGRYTVLTSGRCLYLHDEGGWLEDYAFFPGVNGVDDVPFGGYGYDIAYVFDAFITNYDGSYDAVWPYDFGIVQFADPIGDHVGWLGYRTDPSLGDFQGNLVGYHDDKQDFTMWRSACNIEAENVFDYAFVHDCDFTGGSIGAPIYLYDRNKQARFIVGVNTVSAENGNFALRIHDPVFDWIEQLNE